MFLTYPFAGRVGLGISEERLSCRVLTHLSLQGILCASRAGTLLPLWRLAQQLSGAAPWMAAQSLIDAPSLWLRLPCQ